MARSLRSPLSAAASHRKAIPERERHRIPRLLGSRPLSPDQNNYWNKRGRASIIAKNRAVSRSRRRCSIAIFTGDCSKAVFSILRAAPLLQKDFRSDIVSTRILAFPGISVVADAYRRRLPRLLFRRGDARYTTHPKRPIEIFQGRRARQPNGCLAMIEPGMTTIPRGLANVFTPNRWICAEVRSTRSETRSNTTPGHSCLALRLSHEGRLAEMASVISSALSVRRWQYWPPSRNTWPSGMMPSG